MSNPSTVSPSSNLTLVQGGDSSPSNDDVVWTVELVIQEMIDSTPDAEGLTVEDVLHDKAFRDIKILAEKILKDRQRAQREALQAKEAARQQELQRAKKAKAASLRTTLVRAAGFDPLSDADLAKVEQMVAEPSQQTKGQPNKGSQSDSNDESVIPEEVLRVLSSTKLPQNLFDMGWKAQSVCYHLKFSAREMLRKHIEPLNGKKDKDEQDNALLNLYQDHYRELSRLIPMVTRVVTAWGLHTDREHRHEWATNEQNREMVEIIRKESPNLYSLLYVLPKLESAEEKKAREKAEADKQKAEARKRELYAKLVDRLVKTNPNGLPDGFVERFAAKKSKMEKYLTVELTDELITGIFNEAAINRLKVAEEAKTDAEKEQGRNLAMLYANAAGMDEEALKKGLADMRQQLADAAAAEAAKVATSRNTKGFGEALPVVKSSKDKGEGKPRKGKKGQAKPDGESKPTGKGGRQKK